METLQTWKWSPLGHLLTLCKLLLRQVHPIRAQLPKYHSTDDWATLTLTLTTPFSLFLFYSTVTIDRWEINWLFGSAPTSGLLPSFYMLCTVGNLTSNSPAMARHQPITHFGLFPNINLRSWIYKETHFYFPKLYINEYSLYFIRLLYEIYNLNYIQKKNTVSVIQCCDTKL